MRSRSSILLIIAFLAPVRPALAADLPNAPSSYPALAPDASATASNPWSGLYVGTGISAWGGKGVKGGFGGEGYLGYDKTFDNGIVIGVRGSAGYAPFVWATPRGVTPFTGSSFVGGEATIGYNIGQVTPYVITGIELARPSAFGMGGFSPGDSINDVFSGPGAVQAVGTVGIGAIYHVTPNFSMGIEARASKANNGGAVGWPY
jgi:opacity protein-like surface antigen